MTTLNESKNALSDTCTAVNGITEELIHTANQISVKVKRKMKAGDPSGESAHDVGDMIQSVTSSVKRAASQKRTPKTIHTGESKQVQIKLR